MTDSFENKVVIVTGSSAGIGLAVAQAFIEAGASVVLNGRNQEKLEKAVSEFSSNRDQILAISGDAASENDIERIVNQTIEHFGKIDVLVNNAATVGVGYSIAEMPAEVWDNVLNVNLRGAFLFSKAVIPHLIAQKHGRIINIGGLSSKNPLPFAAADAASKAGLLALTRVLAAELGPHKITANCVIPGFQPETDLGKEFNEKLARSFQAPPAAMIENTKGRTLLKRFETMNEIAGTVLFLASEAGAAITGQNLNVNCGMATY